MKRNCSKGRNEHSARKNVALPGSTRRLGTIAGAESENKDVPKPPPTEIAKAWREIRDGFSVVIGQVPLELMDWVVDPRRQRLIGNPEHGGEQMVDI